MKFHSRQQRFCLKASVTFDISIHFILWFPMSTALPKKVKPSDKKRVLLISKSCIHFKDLSLALVIEAYKCQSSNENCAENLLQSGCVRQKMASILRRSFLLLLLWFFLILLYSLSLCFNSVVIHQEYYTVGPFELARHKKWQWQRLNRGLNGAFFGTQYYCGWYSILWV